MLIPFLIGVPTLLAIAFAWWWILRRVIKNHNSSEFHEDGSAA